MLTGAAIRTDRNAAILGTERKHLEDILEAGQLGRQADVERVSLDCIGRGNTRCIGASRSFDREYGSPVRRCIRRR